MDSLRVDQEESMTVHTTTLTRADLSEAVYSNVGLSRHESAQMVDVVLEEITKALVAEEQVKLSSFGTFSVRHKRQRVGRNPKTGEEVPITPRRVLVFRASHTLKERLVDKLSHISPDHFEKASASDDDGED